MAYRACSLGMWMNDDVNAALLSRLCRRNNVSF